MEIISSCLKKIAINISENSDIQYWASKIKDRFDLYSELKPSVTDGHLILRQIFNILKPIPPKLIMGCGVYGIIIRADMGPNKPYYPNHGYFVDDKIALNADIFYHPDTPDDFFDYRGYFLTRPEQTLYHEFGHGYDFYHGNLSLKESWLKLSGWSETFKPGLQRLIIKEKETPKVVGEWFYNPGAKFTRFYAKRNPWDDWADSFSFYIAGMQDKTPPKKSNYFNNLLKGYF